MEISPDFFKKIFPEFKDNEDKFIQIFLNINSKKLSKDFFGVEWELAVLNLSAHQLITSSKGTLNKEVISENIAGVQRTYKSINSSNECYSSTPYGLEYLRIKKENSYTRCFVT
ncbi:MAG: DUF4054 domain-containing protein [Spirobacillus cienkowskii]|jgi:hypothetical protein|uniref:DUF4054 domain-containing protein n=1 Tax=Spirobacillus cienkowskii TaxID=495820 RepID=A0A369KRZ4_9BACT|nr:MAG: DUF4054 domain-containing protein [Spirobacillus cienkowskii]